MADDPQLLSQSLWGNLSREQMEELAREVMLREMERSSIVQLHRRIERERQWGPDPRSVLFGCGPRCHRHYCPCGTMVETGDPRLCTDEGERVMCYECARTTRVNYDPHVPYVEYSRRGDAISAIVTYDEL